MSPGSAREAVQTVLLAAALLGGLALTAGMFHVRRSVQDLSGTARLPGLTDPATVHSDRFAIPHVFARSEADVFRIQGWLHASERLWQMELFRRTARGRLAELFGEPALEADRFLRTLDLWGAAAAGLPVLPPEERRLLEAYAAGVNAKLAAWSGPLPPEFLVLGIRPEPWEPTASLAIGKVMALDLSHWTRELSRFQARAFLDDDRLEDLHLPYPDWGPTILGAGESGPAAPRRVPGAAAPRPRENEAGRRSRAAPTDPFAVLGGLGGGSSNSWAVAGVRAYDGHPLLANDMHLTLRAPSTWYLVALHAEASGLHVAGLSIPGVPGVVVGYNREVGWVFTNGMVDDMDFVVETVNLDRSAYRHADGWVPFSARPETIQVRGRPDPVVHTVRETVRGPVVSDALPDLAEPLSVLWTARGPTTEAVGLWGMNRATDAEAFDRAVRELAIPHQNVIYATAQGALGYRLSGTVPRRRGWDGSVPAAFDVVGEGWAGAWPPDSLPATTNPPRGYLASANNLQRSDMFGVLGRDYPPPFRARRIDDLLAANLAWTVADMRRAQLDVNSGFAERIGGRAIAAAERIGEAETARAFAVWDGLASVDSRETTVFYIWLYRLRELIAGDEWEGRGAWAFFPDEALLRTLEDGGGAWVDDVRTDRVETLEELEERAMEDALRTAAGRRWGEVHRERSAHPLGRVEWLDRIFRFHVGPRPSPGGPYTVRPDDYRRWSALDSTAWTPPFDNEYGPSQRFVAEMRPAGARGWFLLPTGQSGNPLSRHYRDMAPLWERSELIPVPLDREAARRRAVRTLRLEGDEAR